MQRLLPFVLVACGATSETPQTAPQPASVRPAESAPDPEEPTHDPEQPTQDPEQAAAVLVHEIDGQRVDAATFDALFSRLTLDPTPYEGETVVNADGSYGGASELYHARVGAVVYRYEFHTYRTESGGLGESRRLIRESP